MAANPRAGLPPVPDVLSTLDLKAAYTNVPIAELRSRAEAGNAEAQTVLGYFYWSGENLTKDPATGAQWFRKAADQGHVLAQNNLGICYMLGEGVVKDLKEAQQWFQRAAEQGLPKANANLATLIRENGFSVERLAEYDRYCELAAEQGDLGSAYALGWRHDHKHVPGLPIRREVSAYWFYYAATHGYVPAYNQIGFQYMNGSGVPADLSEAERWFRKGVEVQDLWCEYGLGLLYLRFPEPDLAKAREWISKAAQQDFPNAWYQMGRLAEFHDLPRAPGEAPDYQEAAKWYKRAADRGNSSAAKRLAVISFENKIDTGEDEITRLRRLADLQDDAALLQLARLYLAGKAKPRSSADQPEVLLQLLNSRYYGPGMLELAKLYRTGKLVKKDPVKAILLIHFATLSYESSVEAHELFEELRSSTRPGSTPSKKIEGLEAAFPLYLDATFNNSDPASALKVARSYLDGTYPQDEAFAAAWFAHAAQFRSAEGRAEHERLMSRLTQDQKYWADRSEARLLKLYLQGMP